METFTCTHTQSTNNLFKKDTNKQMRITRYNAHLRGLVFSVQTILCTVLFAICITSIYTVFILRGGNLKCVWKHELSTSTYTSVAKCCFCVCFFNKW